MKLVRRRSMDLESTLNLLLISPLYTPLESGAERVVREQARVIASLKHNITILTSRVHNTPTEELVDGVRIVRPWRLIHAITSGPLFHLSTFLSFFAYAILRRQSRYDIIHCHMAHYPLIIGLLFKSFSSRSRTVVTSHGSDLNVYAKNRIILQIVRHLIIRFDCLVVVSKPLREVALSYGIPSAMIRHVPNGVRTDLFLPLESGLLYYDVIFFGGIKWQKGLEYLIEANAILANRQVSIRLAIVGSGPDLPRLQKLAVSYGLEGIVFHGAMDQESLIRILSKSRIAAFPSISEGLPLAILEAMAAGKAIISTSAGGISDILEHDINAYLIPMKDPVSLANAIELLMFNKERANRLASNARRTVIESYDWSITTEYLLETYDDLINPMS